ncbi:MAG: serine hydrolase domain-containing protein [Candidatus Cybelea sp.]
MKRCLAILFAALWLAALGPATGATASESDAALRTALQHDLNAHLAARSKIEHISTISLSISLHGQPQNINLAAGTTKFGGGVPVTPAHLWQIGSNTKAFTAAIVLQLEAEGKLSIDQTVGHWLPQYPAWKNVTIRRLLNMTSGIPGYDNVPAMLADYAKNPTHDLTIPELIAYVYPGNPHAPPPSTGYDYSNTNYVLAELIIERATHNTYTSELERRFLHSGLGLTSSYYSGTQYPASVLDRMVSGYFFSRDPDNAGLAPLLGTDVRPYSVSWMKSAGAIVSTPEDVTRWARALYTGPMLPPKQRAEMEELVSLKNGKPISAVSQSDPRGFGLGVAQLTTPQTGTIWFYEGMTLGYRVVHMYFPRQDAVIVFGMNSQPDSKQNSTNTLALAVYETLHAAGRL